MRVNAAESLRASAKTSQRGSGSTRWGDVPVRQTLWDARKRLDVRAFIHVLAERTDDRSGLCVSDVGGERWLGATIFPRVGMRRQLELFCAIGWYGATPTRMEQLITCRAKSQPFGGERWRFECPVCHGSRMYLYLVPVARSFACRVCCRLVYTVQRMSKVDAARSRAEDMLLAAIGGNYFKFTEQDFVENAIDNGWNLTMRARPRFMKRRKFKQLCAAFEHARARYWERDWESLAKGLRKIDAMMRMYR